MSVELIFSDFERELQQTRVILERLPEDKLTWKPHEKSMSLGELADHVARLSWFFEIGATSDDYDMANWVRPPAPTSRDEVLKTFDERSAAAIAEMKKLDPAKLNDMWSLKAGSQVFFTIPRVAVLRIFAVNHIIHHRGQLAVYYRMVGVPVPGLYGPSADEQ